jgi:uncharacterized membrane protein YhaH (DUF805 family)
MRLRPALEFQTAWIPGKSPVVRISGMKSIALSEFGELQYYCQSLFTNVFLRATLLALWTFVGGFMNNLLFSYAGRINRAKFWLGAVILTVLDSIVFGISAGYAAMNADHDSIVFIALTIICVVVLIATVYASVCLGIKRYHDHGKSGVWVLIQFVPAIGAIWYFIEAGCLRGQSGPNNYGPDPLDPAARLAAAY